jgi:hypothetical protein
MEVLYPTVKNALIGHIRQILTLICLGVHLGIPWVESG